MLLIINTSGNNSIELLLDNYYTKIETEKQSLTLPTAVIDFIKQHNVSMKDLTAIGVIIGPGSFTGIRMGIAYAKGLSIGLNIPVIGINKFEIYLSKNPDAFVALDSGRGDFFVSAHDLQPCIMDIDTVETEQMKYPMTVGHIDINLHDAKTILEQKLQSNDIQPVIPLYIRPSYAEQQCLKK